MPNKRTNIIFLVNKGYRSVFGRRVRAFEEHLRPYYQISIYYKPESRYVAIFYFIKRCYKEKPHILYIIDIGIATFVAGVFSKLFLGSNIVLDTGDIASDLMRVLWKVSNIEVEIVQILERFFWKICDVIIARGSLYTKYLKTRVQYRKKDRVYFLPDGVDTEKMHPVESIKLRKKLKPKAEITIGTVGSIVWSEVLGICYGWEVVRAIGLLKDEPVKGIIIGNGNGVPILRDKIREFNIEDKIIFTGEIAHSELPEYLAVIDICLSSQTNDRIGNFRTTVKLPEYMACGKYILATRVGEAKFVLPEDMLVDYYGKIDMGYPLRIAEKVRYILAHREVLEKGKENIIKAKEIFEYRVLGHRLLTILRSLLE